jgi:diguanylate cyclase (GGDEF)-like protein
LPSGREKGDDVSAVQQSLSRHAELSAEGLAAPANLSACDREPIHLSGAIQPHGMLLALDLSTARILAASANLAQPPHPCPDLLGAPLQAVFDADVVKAVRALSEVSTPYGALPVRVALPAGPGGAGDYDLIAHRRGPFQIVEFEASSSTGAAKDEFLLNQYAISKALSGADGVERMCEIAVQKIRRLSGFDRVMIYRFDPDAHGCVVAEACEAGLEPYLGLHYPASDIPRQARALYLRNWIRVIPDAAYAPVPILALPEIGGADRIDLCMAVTRSVSPFHIQYLQNMGVRATLTISLVVENQLWGLIACHHGAPKRVDHLQRLAYEALGQQLAVRLGAAEVNGMQTRAQTLNRVAAQVVISMASAETTAEGANAAQEPLLAMVDADGVAMEIEGQRVSIGEVPSDENLEALIAFAAERAGSGPAPWRSEHLCGQSGLPDLLGDPGNATAGAMYLPLPGRGQNFAVWFRGERTRTVRWAGRPDPGKEQALTPLQPRASFAEWVQQVRGRSRPWRAEEIASATELARAMPEILMHRAQNRLARLALHDVLTGLPNRVYLMDKLEAALSPVPLAGADGQPLVGVLFIDLDGFKAINDGLGHEAGDELLKSVAQRLAALLRPKDFTARMGGDEFVVVITPTTQRDACAVAQRIVEAFRAPFVLDGRHRRFVTVSVGVAVVSPQLTPGEALRRADSAMYHAKRSGRSRIALYKPVTRAAVSSRQIEVDELHRAIVAEEITPFFQPVWDLAGGGDPALSGYEALARWRHPQRGLVPPSQFIPLAEEARLIGALGLSMLRQSLRHMREWRDRRLTVAVNVSVRQLIARGFADEVLSTLLDLGLEPQRLCLEITETQVMESPDMSLAALNRLSEAGVKIAIDDFGIGFSSLEYVRNLPATELKIDQRFVAGLPERPKDRAVVKTIVELAHALGMRTVAEGVETQAQLAQLREMGSDLVQGYLLGRPQPPEAVKVALDAREPLQRGNGVAGQR